MKVTMEMNDQQAAIIQEALEEWFRIRMGQFYDLSLTLAEIGFTYEPNQSGKFDAMIAKRDKLEQLFDEVKRLVYPSMCDCRVDFDIHVATDMWSVLRHERYLAHGGAPNVGTRDSWTPIQIGSLPLPKITIQPIDSQECSGSKLKETTELEGKCGSCKHSVPNIPYAGRSEAYIRCLHPKRAEKPSYQNVKKRTDKGCRLYERRD